MCIQRAFGVLVSAALLLLAASLQAKTVYVDKDATGGITCNNSGNGSLGQPVCSLDAGVALMVGGDTLYVRAGTYDGEWFSGPQWPPKPGVPNGTPSQYTFVGAYPDEAVLMLNGSISAGGGLSYVVFDRLVMRPGNFYCDESCHHIRFQNSEIDQSTVVSPSSPDGYGHCINGRGNNNEFLHNKLHNTPLAYFFGLPDPTTNGKYAIYYTGNHNIVDGNEIYDNRGYGIHWYAAGLEDFDDNIIRNNVIHGNGYDDGTRGDANAGLVVSSGHRILVYNNVVYGNTAGIQVNPTCVDCEIYNNTIYDNTLVHAQLGVLGYGCVTNQGVRTILRNNICYQNAGPEIQNYASDLTESNNLVTPSNPLFVNGPAHIFNLQFGSPARDAGFAVTTVTADIAGNARPQPTGGAWDIGAYEYIVASTCPPDCPTTCPPDCPTDESPTIADVYVSPGGHGDIPSDSNGCRTAETITTPKATLASAATCMTIPGKAMVLRGGAFTTLDTRTNPVKGGTSWAAPTKIKRYASEVPVLTMPATATEGVLVFGAAATDAFLEVDGLTLDGASRTNGDGVLVLGSSNMRFKNMTIHHNHYQNVALIDVSDIELLTSTLTNPLGFANVVLYGTSSNVLISGNTITTGVLAGVALDASATSNGVTIAKNAITSTVTGVDVGPGSGATLVNNVIQTQSSAGIRVRSGASGTHVYHNDSVSNTGTGILCESGATSVDIANNITVANGTQFTNTCGALDRGNLKTGTLAEIFTTVPVLKESVPVSPAINSGVDLPSVTDDQISNARPVAVLWDAGAREAQVAPAPGPTTGVSIRVMMFF